MGRGRGEEKGGEGENERGVWLAPDDAKRAQTCAAVPTYHGRLQRHVRSRTCRICACQESRRTFNRRIVILHKTVVHELDR